MCLAIPGQIIEIVDEPRRLARVEVAGVRRTVNIGLLDDAGTGDWVLIHVGFAISQIDEDEAMATRRLLEQMGAEYEQELEELQGERDRVSCGRASTASRAATSPSRCACSRSTTTGLARCACEDGDEQVDVALVEPLQEGDTVLVHAGVALVRVT